ncbi:hypothetical protein DFH29DRAFT_1006627 [Suillus ampliporus]|nr:hypothetical protein DFH29DRAFT_1006627 [Suillus ampliporus]
MDLQLYYPAKSQHYYWCRLGQWFCVGNIPYIGDFPDVYLQNLPLGIRDTGLVTSFTAGITTASTLTSLFAVAVQNNNAIVVTNSVGPLILEPWVEHPNVTVIICANLGGNDAGNAITEPIAMSPADYPA